MTPQGHKRRWHISTQNYGARQNLVFTVVGREVVCPYRWSKQVDKGTGAMVGSRLVLGALFIHVETHKHITEYIFHAAQLPALLTGYTIEGVGFGGHRWTQMTLPRKNWSITAGSRGTIGWQVPLQIAAKTDRWGWDHLEFEYHYSEPFHWRWRKPCQVNSKGD